MVWYTHPAFILGMSLLLIFILLLIYMFVKSGQIVKIILNFSDELIKSIPADRSTFNFVKIFDSNKYRGANILCKLDQGNQPNNIEEELINMLGEYLDDLDELKGYNVFYKVEILNSQVIFSALCEVKEE